MNKVSRITAVLNKDSHPGLMDALRSQGITHIQIEAGRAPVLQEQRGAFALFSSGGTTLVNDPVDIISFLVDSDKEDQMISMIADRCQLHVPGVGSVYSEQVDLREVHPLVNKNTAAPLSTYDKPENLYSELIGITCIVQRGQGDAIARVVLESGACVPTITFGDGTGVRDKLGLLRITIPAEKEVITMVMSSYDAEAVLELAIEAGKLDQPGKGFIYIFSVKQGITRGTSGAAASMEQIIAALDGLKGGMEWRRRGETSARGGERTFLRGLVDVTLVVDEGKGAELVGAAMEVGASGATISKAKFVGPALPEGTDENHVSPAREMANMIVAQNQVDDIVTALKDAGAFSEKAHGMVITFPAPRAFTYLPPKPAD